jgi:hypothetical protein
MEKSDNLKSWLKHGHDFTTLNTLLPFAIIIIFYLIIGEFGNINYQDEIFFGIIIIFIFTFIWLIIIGKRFKYLSNDKIKLYSIGFLVIIIVSTYFFRWWWWEFFGGGPGPVIENYRETLDYILFIALIVILSYLVEDRKFISLTSVRYPLLLLLAVFIKLETINVFPNPPIDVWNVLMLGSQKLIELKNPYAEFYTQLYSHEPNYYPYPPGMLLILMPVRLILMDIRLFFLFIQVLFSIMIYLFAGRNSFAEVLSLFPLFNPFTFFLLHYAWTEPIIIFFLGFLLFYGDKKYGEIWRPIIFAFTATLKQSVWILIPFYLIFVLKKGTSGLKEIIVSFICFTLIMIPFYLWSPNDFIYDIWIFHSNQINYQSLTINSYLIQNPFIFNDLTMKSFLFLYVILLVLFFYWDRIKNKSLEWVQVFQFGFLAMFLFLLWGHLAFMNHFYLIIAGLYIIMLKFFIITRNSDDKEVNEKPS